MKSYLRNFVGSFLCIVLLGSAAAYGQGNGSIVGWGRNDRSQCDVPEPNEGFIAFTAGAFRSYGVKSDRSIVGWGNAYYVPIPEPNTDFMAVSSRGNHCLGLKSDGSIVAWGINTSGKCDVPAPNTDYISITAGYLNSWGIKSDGQLMYWGDDMKNWQLIPQPNIGFIDVGNGANHSIGLKSDGTLQAWGTSGPSSYFGPNGDFIAISAGDIHNLALRADGTIVAWGINDYGQCDVPEPNEDFIAISAGWWHSVALKSDGTVVAWGQNNYGQCDVPEMDNRIVAISAGMYHTLALTEPEPPVIQCRIDIKPGSESNPIQLRQGHGVVPVALLTDEHFDALDVDHETVCFGPAGAMETHMNQQGMTRHEEDIDKDGDLDLLFHFLLSETGIQFGDTEASLTGETFDGQAIAGTDVIRTVSKKNNRPSAEIRTRVSPNPFNPMTAVSFRTDQTEHVRIAVYDIRGGLVRELANRVYMSGEYSIDWNGRNTAGLSVPSGEYVFRVDVGGEIQTHKAILLR